MKNRHGEEWDIEVVVTTDGCIYKVITPNQWWRIGGKTGQESIDYSDIGFIDFSGGPFIQVGMEIHGKEISKIYCKDGEVFLEFKSEQT